MKSSSILRRKNVAILGLTVILFCFASVRRSRLQPDQSIGEIAITSFKTATPHENKRSNQLLLNASISEIPTISIRIMPTKIQRNKTKKIPENNIKPLLFDANTPKIPTTSVHTFLSKTQQQKTRNNSTGMVPKKKMDIMPPKIQRNKTKKIPENNIKPLLLDANTPKIPTTSVYTFLSKTQQQKTRNNSIGMVPKKKMDLWVKDYIDFHNSAIEDGKLKDGFPYVIYACSKKERCGGVGDRVLGMVKAFYFAMMEGRVLLIESEFPVSLKYYLNPNLVRWDAKFPQTEKILDTMGKRATRNSINKYEDILGYYFLNCNGDKVKKLSDIMKDKQMLKLKRKYEGKKVSQAKSKKFNEYSSAFHQAFWTLFKFDDVILSRAEEMKQDAGLALLNNAPIRGKEMMVPYVGLHNRQGDHLIPGVKTNNRLQRKTVTTQLLECYHTLKRHFPDEYQAAYIASDNYEAKKGMKKMDNTIHYPPEMEIFHVDLSTRKEGNPKMHEEEVRRGFIDTWAEVAVLIDSDCLIISRSMFSTLAYYIRDDKETCNVHILDCDDSAVASRTNIYRMDPQLLVYTPWKRP